jgi:hypothetical protein
MLLRLLASLCLLSLLETSVAQQSGTAPADNVPDTCPVTKPSSQPFVPPTPYSTKPNADIFWYGTGELWTSLPTTGTWNGLPHYTPTDPSFRQKMFWGRQGYDWHTEPRPNLKVTGRRLDSSAPPLAADRASNGWVYRNQPFMVVGINFPTLGCWEVTGHYGIQELTFVVWVAQ